MGTVNPVSPDDDEPFGSTPARPMHCRNDSDSLAPSSHEPSTPATTFKHTAKANTASKTPSSTHKSRTTLKHTLKDLFAEGATKESQMLERLGMQKHERAIGEQELKRRKLERKVMEQQHQREREREQHEFRMLQMRMIMSRNQPATPMAQSPLASQSPYEGFGLMAELNDGTLPGLQSGTSYSI
jgi:hypothetical protein